MIIKRVFVVFVVSLIPVSTALAQTTPTEPGQDPFALSPELLQLFQGYEGEDSSNSLFNGDNMKLNGLFAPSVQQLGGASPDLTAPVRDNQVEVQQGPTFLVIRSEYTPSGDLTKDSIITLKVTLRNIGEHRAENITFRAMLQDNYIVLLDDPAPAPPFTNDPSQTIPDQQAEDEAESNNAPTPIPTINDPTVTNPYLTLIWDKVVNHPNPNPVNINLDPGQETTFSWSFQPQKDDVVIRWRFVAEFGAGESVLRQWIPVKNPNPTGVLAPGAAAGGIPVSCSSTGTNQSQPFPQGQSGAQIVAAMEGRWKFDLIDGNLSWADSRFLPVLKIWWDTLSAVECTPFINEINRKNDGSLKIMATSCIGGLWGTYGLECFPGGLAINIANQQGGIDRGIPHTVTQNIIHELGHAYNNDRGSNPPYWTQYVSIYNSVGGLSGYGRSSITENWSDVLGFYVARCADEVFSGSGPNPYSIGYTEFYNFAKTQVFGGVEFGPPAPSTVTCQS